VQDGVLAVVVDERSVFDSLVLFFEVGSECWAVAAALCECQLWVESFLVTLLT
jgi:hypothetical protein